MACECWIRAAGGWRAGTILNSHLRVLWLERASPRRQHCPRDHAPCSCVSHLSGGQFVWGLARGVSRGVLRWVDDVEWLRRRCRPRQRYALNLKGASDPCASVGRSWAETQARRVDFEFGGPMASRSKRVLDWQLAAGTGNEVSNVSHALTWACC